MSRTTLLTCLLLIYGCLACSDELAHGPSNYLYQMGRYDSLAKGNFQGQGDVNDALHYGGFGLGTLDSLDGEVVVFDGQLHTISTQFLPQIWPKAQARKSPFLAICSSSGFLPSGWVQAKSLQDLRGQLQAKLDTSRLWAIHLSGQSMGLLLRSVHKQRSFGLSLAQVLLKDQVLLKLPESQGHWVGFWVPSRFAGKQVPGFHFHYVGQVPNGPPNTFGHGGHVLDLEQGRLEVELKALSGIVGLGRN